MRDLIRAFPALRAFTDVELDMLMGATAARAVAQGTVLIQEGTQGSSCFLVVRGALEVKKQSPEGEVTVATVNPGAWVGQIALVDRGRRSASVVAKLETELLELSRDTFEKLLASKSPLGLRFQEQVAITSIRQLRSATKRLSAALAMRGTLPPGGASGGHGASHGLGGRAGPRTRELGFIQAAAEEWGIALDDVEIDDVEVVRDESAWGQKEVARSLRNR